MTKATKIIWILFALGASLQASFILTGGTMWQTIASVTLLAVVSTLVAYRIGGLKYAAILSVGIMMIGFLAEVIGVATNIPFGEYAYTGGLGWSVLGVSLIVPLAWLMLAYPSWHAARYLVRGAGTCATAGRVLLGAWALTAWDVFLDTQMVNAGNWGWANPEPSLIGTPGIPLTNYAGWLLVSVVMMLFIEFLTRRKPLDVVRPVLAVYLWTYVGSIIANLTFFNEPIVALTGAILMGVVAIPLVAAIIHTRAKAKSLQRF